MKVIHPAEMKVLEGGIKTSIKHQRECMDKQGIEYTRKFEDDADVLHLNILGPGDIYRLKKAKRKGIPVAVHTHEIGENFGESFMFTSYLTPIVERYVDYFYKRADLLICPSRYAADVLEKRGIETEKQVISNGIDPERFENLEDFGEENDNFTAVNVSIVFERKGLTDFIETGRNIPDMDFKWFGPKFSKLLMGREVDKKIDNAPENVSFPGYADDVRDAFATGDAFFFPTKSESQGLSVIEAAYCGMPIVVRDIPVYEKMLTDGENCLKADSVKGFTEAMRRLKDDEDLRQKIASNARELAEEHVLDNIAEKLEQAYTRAASMPEK